MKQSKGITLVALIVTVIILLILAGISIAQLTGNGLFEKAKLAKEKQENAQIKEETELSTFEYEIDMNSRNTVTIPKEEYERLKNNITYSAEEQIVGTWINNKPIYERTVQMTVPTVTTSTVETNILDISS